MNRELIYIATYENLGYGKGNNVGADFAKNHYQDEFFLFSNIDLKFPQKFSIEELLSPIKKNPAIAVVGPDIRTPAGEWQSPYKKISTFSALFLNYFDLLLPAPIKITRWITNVEKTEHSKSCYWVSGSFMAVRTEAFQKVHGFDSYTFLYCEEMILSERLLKKGYQIWYTNEIKAIHEHGQTVKSIFAVIDGIQISFESSIHYYREYRKMPMWIEEAARLNFRIFKSIFLLIKRMKGE